VLVCSFSAADSCSQFIAWLNSCLLQLTFPSLASESKCIRWTLWGCYFQAANGPGAKFTKHPQSVQLSFRTARICCTTAQQILRKCNPQTVLFASTPPDLRCSLRNGTSKQYADLPCSGQRWLLYALIAATILAPFSRMPARFSSIFLRRSSMSLELAMIFLRFARAASFASSTFVSYLSA